MECGKMNMDLVRVGGIQPNTLDAYMKLAKD